MIFAARQARTANRFAPAQTRRTNAQAWLFGQYIPSTVMWFDAYRATQPYGQAVARMAETARNNTIVQATAIRQPASTVYQNVKALQFKSSPNFLGIATTAAVPVGGTKQLTVVTVNNYPANSGLSPMLAGDSSPFGTITATACRRTSAGPIDGYLYGNAGNGRETGGANDLNVYVQDLYQYDTAAALAVDKIELYRNNSLIGPSGATYVANTSTFSDYIWGIGSDIGFASATVGYISEVMVFNRKLTAAERQDIYRSLQDVIGKGWT